jgi:hypothetical protein
MPRYAVADNNGRMTRRKIEEGRCKKDIARAQPLIYFLLPDSYCKKGWAARSTQRHSGEKTYYTQDALARDENSQGSTKWLLVTDYSHTHARIHTFRRAHTRS